MTMPTIETLQDIVERRIAALINLKRMRMEGYKSRLSGSEIDDGAWHVLVATLVRADAVRVG